MATISDIQNALANLILTAVYPNGINLSSVANIDVLIYPGWPNPAQLEQVLAGGKAHIAIFQLPNMQRNVTRFLPGLETQYINSATLFLNVNEAAQTVTVTGTVSADQNCEISVNDLNYIYQVQSSDTVNTIASAFASSIPSATATGNVITIPDAYKITARVGTTGVAVKELKRQQVIFQIMVYAPLQNIREILSDAIETYLAKSDNYYLNFQDDKPARIIWHGTQYIDAAQKSELYKAILSYQVEYATTEKITYSTITALDKSIQVLPVI